MALSNRSAPVCNRSPILSYRCLTTIRSQPCRPFLRDWKGWRCGRMTAIAITFTSSHLQQLLLRGSSRGVDATGKMSRTQLEIAGANSVSGVAKDSDRAVVSFNRRLIKPISKSKNTLETIKSSCNTRPKKQEENVPSPSPLHSRPLSPIHFEYP